MGQRIDFVTIIAKKDYCFPENNNPSKGNKGYTLKNVMGKFSKKRRD